MIWTLVNFLNCFEKEGSLFLVLGGRQQLLWLANQPPVLEIQEEGRCFGCGRGLLHFIWSRAATRVSLFVLSHRLSLDTRRFFAEC